ncbi:MAG: hypothetical protein FJ013_03340 [Chloroflexi bacterium]|nr:hypothetical protein [Chloroflexota bacterium]MBM4453600.1 hypothetical protein [Chloroflexota bacterium]
MKELTDYSGEFNPKLKPEDLSKELLVDLLKLYGRLYRAVDGFWYLAVMDKVNEETATECDFAVWEQMAKYEVERINKISGVQGTDVPAFMKYLQLSPWAWNMEWDVELSDADSAVLTVTKCYTLEALEREGKGRDGSFCKEIETKMWDIWAAGLNPNIKFTYTKLPPRKSKDDICCQWKVEMAGKSTV